MPASRVPEEAAGPYLRALARHRALVAGVTLLTVAFALYGVSTRVRTYQASASVFVSPLGQGDPTFTGTGVVLETGDPSRTVQTAAALLDSPQAAAAAATKMGPDWSAGRVQSAVSVTPRGQSDVLAVTGRAPTAPEAVRLANTFARAAVANRAAIVQRNVAAQVRALQARLSKSPQTSLQGQDLRTSIVQLRAVEATGRDPTLSVSQPAQPPAGRTGTSNLLIIVLAALAGFAIGCIGALAADFFSPLIRDEREAASLSPGPILAAVPKVSSPGPIVAAGPKGSRNRHRNGLSPLLLPPIAFEQIRLLRAQIPKKEISTVIMVTSADSGDGKTTIAAALAAALTETEEEAILLDLDLREPAVANVFGVEQSLDEHAQPDWNTNLLEMLMPVPGFPRLKILPARRGDISTIEGLIARLPDLLIEAESIANFVILDTAPVGEVSDAVRIATECDGVVMVVRPRHTNRSKLVHARDLLERVHAPLIGTVLVGQPLPMISSKYYGYTSDAEDDRTSTGTKPAQQLVGDPAPASSTREPSA
jgi:Mrp family chromosome partitioning ATPase/capsular polysaccharide biosynthesis protein